jgi:TRAP-type transport system small permease protein
MFGTATGRVLGALGAAAGVVVIRAMAWQFTTYAGKLARAGETTWVLKIPTAPFWYTIAAILWIAALVQAIVVVLESAKAMRKA